MEANESDLARETSAVFDDEWLGRIRSAFLELPSQWGVWFRFETALELKVPIEQGGLPLLARSIKGALDYSVGRVPNEVLAKPTFLADSIIAHVGSELTRDSWALRTNGDFCALVDFPELKGTEGELLCPKRIMQLLDCLAHCRRLYTKLKVPEDQPIHMCFLYSGMKNVRLNTDDQRCHLHGNYVCNEDSFAVPRDCDRTTTICELRDNIVQLAMSLGKEFFVMFHGAQVPHHLYEEMWEEYVARHPSQ